MIEEKPEEMQKKKSNRIFKILFVVFLAIAVCSSVLLARNWIIEKRAADKFDELTKKTTDTTQAQADPVTEPVSENNQSSELNAPVKNLDWTSLQQENEDIYSWIYIPDTNVDYPILQHATEDNYYLEHNLDGSSGYPGCIYTQRINSKDFTNANTILYGHNMKNGSMFNTLHYFEDNQFFDEHSFFYIYTAERVLVYEVFAACEFTDEHLLHKYDFNTIEGRNDFIDDIRNTRGMTDHVRSSLSVDSDDKLVTLSTCINGKDDYRYLVIGVLQGEIK